MNAKIAATAAATIFLAAGAASAQTAPPETTGAYTDTAMAPAMPVEEDDDMDWGWIGLIGLAGLLGLRKRRDDVRATSTTARR